MNGFILPGYSRYRITSDGQVYNVESATWLSGNTNPDGYVNFRLTNDDGVTTTLGRHQLVATIHYGSCPEGMQVVNHRNGIKGDDRPDNLEWATYQGNIEHAGAMGLTSKCLPVSTRNPSTGEITHYPSATACARALGQTKDAILWRLRHGQECVYPEGLQYRQTDDAPWIDSTVYRQGRNQPTLLRDVCTNAIIRFEKQQDLARHFGVSDAAVSVWLSDADQRLIHNQFQVKLESDLTPWREISDPLRENGRVRPVVVINQEGCETTFASAKECAEQMGLKPTTLNERLKSNGQKTFKDGFRFRYY